LRTNAQESLAPERSRERTNPPLDRARHAAIRDRAYAAHHGTEHQQSPTSDGIANNNPTTWPAGEKILKLLKRGLGLHKVAARLGLSMYRVRSVPSNITSAVRMATDLRLWMRMKGVSSPRYAAATTTHKGWRENIKSGWSKRIDWRTKFCEPDYFGQA
jgi:hypothetical protein